MCISKPCAGTLEVSEWCIWGGAVPVNILSARGQGAHKDFWQRLIKVSLSARCHFRECFHTPAGLGKALKHRLQRLIDQWTILETIDQKLWGGGEGSCTVKWNKSFWGQFGRQDLFSFDPRMFNFSQSFCFPGNSVISKWNLQQP